MAMQMRVRVAVHSRHENSGAIDQLSIEPESDDFVILFSGGVVRKFYVDAIEFVRAYPEAMNVRNSGVAIIEFSGYNKFQIDRRENYKWL